MPLLQSWLPRSLTPSSAQRSQLYLWSINYIVEGDDNTIHNTKVVLWEGRTVAAPKAQGNIRYLHARGRGRRQLTQSLVESETHVPPLSLVLSFGSSLVAAAAAARGNGYCHIAWEVFGTYT